MTTHVETSRHASASSSTVRWWPATGSLPGDDPARPDEVVLHAPSTSPAQLDRAVDAARSSQAAWATLGAQARAESVTAAAEAGVATVEAGDLARLLHPRARQTLTESIFDRPRPWPASPPPSRRSWRRRSPAREVSGGATRVEWVPHGVVAAVLPFNWPVSVIADKVLPHAAGRGHHRGQGASDVPRHCTVVAAAMAGALPPGVLNVVNGPDAALGATLVGHPRVDMVSFTGGVAAGQAVMAAAAATTRPVVLELGGNDAAILAPDVAADHPLAERIVEAAFVTSGQVCMAIKRLYVHRDRMDETVAALADRLAGEVVGDGLAEEVTMSTVHTASAHDRVEAMLSEAAASGATVVRPGRVRAADTTAGGYFVSPALVVAPTPGSGIVRQEQFAPALPVIPYGDLDAAVDAANDTRFGLCASVWSNDDALAAAVASRLSAGTVFVNAHGISAIDMVRADGRVEAVGLRRRAGRRGHAGFRAASGSGCAVRSGRSGGAGVTVAVRGGIVVDGTGTPAVRADVVMEGSGWRPSGPMPAAGRAAAPP